MVNSIWKWTIAVCNFKLLRVKDETSTGPLAPAHAQLIVEVGSQPSRSAISLWCLMSTEWSVLLIKMKNDYKGCKCILNG